MVAQILAILLSVGIFAILFLAIHTENKLNRRIHILEHYLDQLIRASYDAVDAYQRVRNNGSAETDRLALDRAVSQLTNAAEVARKREKT